jgi:hypothetical protein
MVKFKYIPISLLFLLVLFCCTNGSKSHHTTMNDTSAKETLVGNDADEHGCKASAGYTWSVLKNDCIRLWETGIQLKPIGNKENQTSIATVVLSNDSTKAELYIATEKGSILLDKQSSSIYAGNNYEFLKDKDKWTLKQSEKLIYQE